MADVFTISNAKSVARDHIDLSAVNVSFRTYDFLISKFKLKRNIKYKILKKRKRKIERKINKRKI